MRYVPAGLSGLLIFSVLLTSLASAASVKDDAARQAAEIPADGILKFREGEQQVHQQKSKPADARVKPELEWQLKLDALSEKLRLARKSFDPDTIKSFDFDLLQPNSWGEIPKLPGTAVPK